MHPSVLARGFCIVGIWVATALSSVVVHADEGMWLFNAPPTQKIKSTYGFELTQPWLDHVQKASVRFNNGGSGAFISKDGLIITNHHVAADIIEKMSTPEHNYLRDGFHARTRAEEIKSTDLELNVLVSIENVTDRVNAAVAPGPNAMDAYAQRRAVIAAIEKESLAKTGLRSDVVTLYQGAEYHLYRYKRYTDVRLVFAVDLQAAFFGGDPDNFEFPRYNLDISLFRAYENGQPAKITDYLKVDPRGAAENELVFVSGNPGTTDRLMTVAELAAHLDSSVNAYIKNNEVALGNWSARAEENARRAEDDFLNFQNSRKVYDGRLQTLYDPAFFKNKISEETALQNFAHSRSDLAGAADAWARVASAQAALTENYQHQFFLESRDPTRWPIPTFDSDLLRYGRLLYRLPTERAKPNGDRLREYRDSGNQTLELDLFSEQPIYRDLEKIKLTQFLTLMVEELGADDPDVQRVLAGQPPVRRAAELIDGTKLVDVAYRKKLAAMSADEMEHVGDPVISLMRTIDADARASRRILEEQTNAKAQGHADIAKVMYAKYGDSIYPDATFTLRLSYGTIKGYDEDAAHVAPFTDLAGIFRRSAEHHGHEPFDLPPRWASLEKKLDLKTPFNFVTTCDITGGNSGSPTINRAGEFVGIIFDGNIHSLSDNYAYDEVKSRAVSVDVRAIIECMRKVYGADELVAEMLEKR
jgi:hypothetical protein